MLAVASSRLRAGLDRPNNDTGVENSASYVYILATRPGPSGSSVSCDVGLEDTWSGPRLCVRPAILP